MPSTTTPFAKRGVSLRLYPHNELDAEGTLREICAQAKLGLDAGFDGVMTSEHHGGVGGYFPDPLLLTTFFLEESATGWAAASPLLLPLRPTALVAEDVAWLNVRHPGRVGLGVAAGAAPRDFEAMQVPVEEAVPRFKAELPRLVQMLQGRALGGLDADLALQRCATSPVPVLSAVSSPGAARRAADVGAGMLLEGVSNVEKLTRMNQAFRAAGGTGTIMLIRRVWLGQQLTELIDQQRRFYEGLRGGPGRPLAEDQTISCDSAEEMATRLHDLVRACDADAVNLRVHLPGITPGAIRDQIGRLADEVVPLLRTMLAAS